VRGPGRKKPTSNREMAPPSKQSGEKQCCPPGERLTSANTNVPVKKDHAGAILGTVGQGEKKEGGKNASKRGTIGRESPLMFVRPERGKRRPDKKDNGCQKSRDASKGKREKGMAQGSTPVKNHRKSPPKQIRKGDLPSAATRSVGRMSYGIRGF